MIARLWRGATAEARGDEYYRYLRETGLKEYRATPGNRGAHVFRRFREGRTEFLLISKWESWDAIRRFAGDEIEKTVYYPKDQEFLVSMDPTVDHYEVLEGPASPERS